MTMVSSIMVVDFEGAILVKAHLSACAFLTKREAHLQKCTEHTFLSFTGFKQLDRDG